MNTTVARLTAGTAMVLSLSACTAVAQETGKPVTEQQIAALFTAWNNALATGDAEKVADLYAPDAVLLPTVSNEVRINRPQIVDYFKKFLQSHPSGAIEQEHVKIADPDTAIDTGIYVFTLHQDGQETKVRARYTYVYEKIGGKWLILNHHSSVMPEK